MPATDPSLGQEIGFADMELDVQQIVARKLGLV
jgi:hypothetical protein